MHPEQGRSRFCDRALPVHPPLLLTFGRDDRDLRVPRRETWLRLSNPGCRLRDRSSADWATLEPEVALVPPQSLSSADRVLWAWRCCVWQVWQFRSVAHESLHILRLYNLIAAGLENPGLTKNSDSGRKWFILIADGVMLKARFTESIAASGVVREATAEVGYGFH